MPSLTTKVTEPWENPVCSTLSEFTVKLQSIIAHLKDMPNLILDYNLAMTSNIERVQVTRNSSD